MLKTTTFLSSDGEIFEVDEVFAMESRLAKYMIKIDLNGGLPIRITSKIFSMVIDFCNKHVELAHAHEDLEAFDSEFVKLDHTTLIDLIHAAYRLRIKSLLELTCKTVVDMITWKNAQEIHKIFDMENDFTPEDMEEMWSMDSWPFK